MLVDLGGYSTDEVAVALAEEVLGLTVLEERVLALVEKPAPLDDQRRHPHRLMLVEPVRDADEALKVTSALHRAD